jgi:hypothetical protein
MSTVMPKNSPSVASRNSSMSFMFRRSPNGLVRSQNVRHIAVAADRHGVETFATTSRHHAQYYPPIRRRFTAAPTNPARRRQCHIALGFDPVVPGNRGWCAAGRRFPRPRRVHRDATLSASNRRLLSLDHP